MSLFFFFASFRGRYGGGFSGTAHFHDVTVEKCEITVDKPRLLWITSRIDICVYPRYGVCRFGRAKIWR